MPQKPELRDIQSALFRANPAYDLILFDRLPVEYQQSLSHLREDPDFYGVLWPQREGLSVKAVDQHTALLFLTLQQPGALPGYIVTMFGDRCDQAVAELVLDAVLEIAQGTTGEFVSSAAAYSMIHEQGDTSSRKSNRISQLSVEALRYAQALEVESAPELSARLYVYNTIPASPGWRRLVPSADAAASYLGIDADGRYAASLDQHWIRSRAPTVDGGWRAWHPRRSRRGTATTPNGPTHKLYVSPVPDKLPEVLGDVLDALATCDVSGFKIGRDLYGLLRPDKMVAYFAGLDELASAAERLRQRLEGCPAQGVPFTAAIDGSALLSWGMDPPNDDRGITGHKGESWRLWVTNHLAVSLLSARTEPTDTPPWQFALMRLGLEGVDTDNWTPQQAIWHRERSG